MKKFTTILLLLLMMTMGVGADVNPIEPTTNTSNPVYYKIGSNRGGFLTYNGSSTNVTHEDLSYDALWYFMTRQKNLQHIAALQQKARHGILVKILIIMDTIVFHTLTILRAIV